MSTSPESRSERKSRNVRVSDLMANQVITVSKNQSMHDAAEVMLAAGRSAAVVVDEMGVCVGVVSSRDYLKFEHDQEEARQSVGGGVAFEVVTDVDSSSHIEDTPFELVQRHMTPAVQTISADAPAIQAAKYMIAESIHHLFVLDETERPVGSLSALELMECMLEHCDMDEN